MEAQNNLKQLIRMFSTVDEEDLDLILDCFQMRLFKKNEIILSAGDVSKEFYFINRGCIRTYFITKQGNEKTRYIMIEPYSFQNRKIESLVTLSAKERYDELLRDTPKMTQRVSNKILASYLDIKQETLSRLKSR